MFEEYYPEMKDTNEWEHVRGLTTAVLNTHDNLWNLTQHDVKPLEIKDVVNHPSHYTSHPSGVECIEITEHYNFCIGNAIKYLWRSGLKEGNSNIQDLKKAMWYIQREIDNNGKV